MSEDQKHYTDKELKEFVALAAAYTIQDDNQSVHTNLEEIVYQAQIDAIYKTLPDGESMNFLMLATVTNEGDYLSVSTPEAMPDVATKLRSIAFDLQQYPTSSDNAIMTMHWQDIAENAAAELQRLIDTIS